MTYTPTTEERLTTLEARVKTLGERLSALMGESPDQLVGDDLRLFNALKDWRRTKAAELNVPTYVVFPDKVLATLSSSRPTNEFALKGIKGISDKRIAEYGADVLSIINETW